MAPFSEPPVLYGPRTIVRVPGPEAANAVARYYARERAYLAQWTPAVPPALDQERYWRFALDAHLRELEAGEGAFFFVFAAHSPDEVIGFVQYSAIVGEPRHSAHVGYALSEQHAGNGLMAEALRPTLPWAFDTFGLHRLEAYYLPHNRASGGVLKKLGFRVEGLAREFTQVGQRWEDHLCASLLVHELRGRRP